MTKDEQYEILSGAFEGTRIQIAATDAALLGVMGAALVAMGLFAAAVPLLTVPLLVPVGLAVRGFMVRTSVRPARETERCRGWVGYIQPLLDDLAAANETNEIVSTEKVYYLRVALGFLLVIVTVGVLMLAAVSMLRGRNDGVI